MSDAATDTITKLVHDPTKRHDFVLLIDVKDGNPNGDPDAGNMPRIDPETMQGLMSAESLKRKVRDYVDITEGDDRLKIYVQHGEFLADRRRNAVERRAAAAGVEDPPPRLAADFMCEEFFDVRMFGAVMSFKEANAGQVRGPMQVTQARTIDPIVSIDFTLTAPAQNRSDIDRSLVADGDSAPDAGTPRARHTRAQVDRGLRAVPGEWHLQRPLRRPHRAGRGGSRYLLARARADLGPGPQLRPAGR